MTNSKHIDPTDASLLSLANALYDRCLHLTSLVDAWLSKLPHRKIEGISKLRNLIKSEAKFLEKLRQNPSMIKASHVKSTNLVQLERLFETIQSERNVIAVYKSFNFLPSGESISKRVDLVMNSSGSGGNDNSETSEARNENRMIYSDQLLQKIVVDVVSENGLRWVKIRARNSKGVLHEFLEFESDSDSDSDSHSESDPKYEDAKKKQISENQLCESEISRCSDKSLELLSRYLAAAEQNSVHYQTPKVILKFTNADNVSSTIVNTIERLGITVELANSNFCSSPPSSGHSLLPGVDLSTDVDRAKSLTEVLNLDITTLCALVSSLSHTHSLSQAALQNPAFREQLADESISPILPQLYKVFKHRELVCCWTSYLRFAEIVNSIGGENERNRAIWLFRFIDDTDSNLNIPSSARILNIDGSSSLPIPPIPQTDDTFHSLSVSIIADVPWTEQQVPRTTASRTRLKSHHHFIFGTGENKKMTTITANKGLVRSLKDVGLNLSVWCHGPRSLTERKE
ncbi:hypothetical protein BKA69DRAFT_1035349 [Paraphysoderma sedebokerense]|nr:hypothetical protein BKA69DRAFT_1035349 [Paraphysoderma sedebokerense]